MSATNTRLKLSLPVIEEIGLSSFHLYKKQPNARVEVDRSVFCLIGANGLGKSTFLNTVLYGLTGAIPIRGKKFLTMDEYAREATRPRHVRDYFGGRLPESSRSKASISLSLAWPDHKISLTRPMFQQGGAGHFEVHGRNRAGKPTSTKYEGFDQFGPIVAKRSGLESFDHFLFLMHFVCVFDEDRHLLFWDQRAFSSAIMLAFGQSLDHLEEQDSLNEQIRREDSRARNAKFMATKAKEQIKSIEDFLTSQTNVSALSDEELERQHERLQDELESASAHLVSKDKELRDIEGDWGTKSAALSEARLEYAALFAERTASTSNAFHHPVIRATISEDRCAVCGTVGVGASIQDYHDHNQCPLCNTALAAPKLAADFVEKLTSVDRRIETYRLELDAIVERRRRIASERDAASLAEQAAHSTLDTFLDESPDARWGLGKDQREAIPEGLKDLRAQEDKFNKDAANHRRERNKLRRKLAILETDTSRQYEQYGGAFVTRFRELAGAFIGLPIDINLSQKTGVTTGFDVDLRMNDQIRPNNNTVSESQRFFLEIALRMALVEFIAQDEATLVIDTPEGSLDIAYEAKAGRMFSDFAGANNKLLMTANLRSSALLEELAKLQGQAGMQLVKMTEWAELSDVQKAEEDRFERAYEEIERHLR